MNRNSVVLTGAALCAAAGAWAQQGGGALRSACAAQVRQFCAGVPSGGGRVLQCLRAHKDQLSAACAAAIPQRQTPQAQAPRLSMSVARKNGTLQQVCGAEAAQFCPSAGGSTPLLLSCLKKSMDELSNNCHDAVASAARQAQAAAPGAAPARAAAAGAARGMTFGGRKRSYLVHRPPQYRTGGPALPLVLALHGGGGSAAEMEDKYGLDAYADRYGMIVVYPEGISAPNSRLHTWNAGTCCGLAQKRNVDDVGFLSAVIDAVTRDEGADPRRVFVTGHSNGAQMSYRLACEASRKVAAIAPVSGQDSTLGCPQSRPVPVLHIHGTSDHCARYDGGTCGGCLGRALGIAGDDPRPCDAVQDSVARRARAYGCSADTETAPGGGPVVCSSWKGCPAGGGVTLCRIEGGGHEWQGAAPQQMCVRDPEGQKCRAWESQVGPAVPGVDTDRMIFDFFEKQSRGKG